MKKLVLLIAILAVGCVTTRNKALEERVDNLERTMMMMQAGEAAAAKRIFGRACLQGAGCMDAIAGAADDDMCLVIDSNHMVSFYKYNSTSTYAHNSPWVIDDGTLAGTERWEMTVGSYVRNADSGASYLRLYEDYTTGGQNYYELTVPSAITTNETFTIGRWRTEAYSTNSDKTLDEDDTYTVFQITTSGWDAAHDFDLPEASTCPGCEFMFWITSGVGGEELRIDPNDGTDLIIDSAGAGKYIWADDGGDFVHLRMVGNDRWAIMNADGLPTGWASEP